MSADVLRKAAALIRERAEAATPGPWGNERDRGGRETGDGHVVFGNRHRPVGTDRDVVEFVGKCWGWGPIRTNAEHIASWHPAVALAVASAIDDVATSWEAANGWAIDPDGDSIPFEDTVDGGWLAVARAYLRSDA